MNNQTAEEHVESEPESVTSIISLPGPGGEESEHAPRKRATAEERTQHVADFLASGQPVSAYAETHGLKQQTLSLWVKQAKEGKTGVKSTVAVDNALVNSRREIEKLQRQVQSLENALFLLAKEVDTKRALSILARSIQSGG